MLTLLLVAGPVLAGVPATNQVEADNGWAAGMTINDPDALVRTMAVFDDGNGAELYAGGSFVAAGGDTVNNLASWNGSRWPATGNDESGPTRRAGAWSAEGAAPTLR